MNDYKHEDPYEQYKNSPGGGKSGREGVIAYFFADVGLFVLAVFKLFPIAEGFQMGWRGMIRLKKKFI